MILRRIMKVLIVAVAALAACGAAVRVYPPVLFAAFAVAGRAPAFAFAEVTAAAGRHGAYFPALEDVTAKSRITHRRSDSQSTSTPFGVFWEPRVNGSTVLSQWAEMQAKYSGLQEYFVQPGDVVLDCGANVGVFTRAALDAGADLVVAVEPSPRNLACLRRNLANEIAMNKVIVAPVGVWDKDETLTLVESDAPAEDSFVRGSAGHKRIPVPLTTVDGLVRSLGLKKVDFIKLDIEGAEKRALAGARETIAKYRPALEISVNHLSEDPEQVPAIVLRAWPRYQVRLLSCQLRKEDWRLAAEILYFDPRGE